MRLKAIGFGLFFVGLVVASWFAARFVPVEVAEGVTPEAMDRVKAWAEVAALPFLGGWVLMIVGAVLARKGAPKQDYGSMEGGTEVGVLDVTTEQLKKMSALLEELGDGQSADVPGRLDGLLSDDVPEFLGHRPALVKELGLERFAEMIGHFAMMERGAARAWSALTDGVNYEAVPSLKKARRGIEKAIEVMER